MADVQPLIDALGQRSAPGEAVIVPGVSHNLKLVTWPTDPGFAGPLAPAVGDKLVSLARALCWVLDRLPKRVDHPRQRRRKRHGREQVK